MSLIESISEDWRYRKRKKKGKDGNLKTTGGEKKRKNLPLGNSWEMHQYLADDESVVVQLSKHRLFMCYYQPVIHAWLLY